MTIVRDDFSVNHQGIFPPYQRRKYLSEIAPRKVEVVRNDGGGGFTKGVFGALCTAEKIRQEFTTADFPQYNGVAERQVAIIDAAGLAARI